MIFLRTADPTSTTFKILLIASEIIIPLIVFVGAYYFFKPVFDKQEEEAKAKANDALEKSEETETRTEPDSDSEELSDKNDII